MTYLIALDDGSMANRLHMKAIGHAVKAIMAHEVVLVHDCLDYTDTLIQTGLMRQVAAVRAARELNRKLVTWFADFGVACVGIHGDQRSLITAGTNTLTLDRRLFGTYPANTLRVVSTLVATPDGHTESRPLPDLVSLFRAELSDPQVRFASETLKNGFFH